MPQLGRAGTRRLLKTVRGKPHANDEDHEETDTTPSTLQKRARPMETEEDINAEPLSSSDEAQPVAKPAPPPPKSKRPAQKKPSTTQESGKRGLKRPAGIRVPKVGTFDKGKEDRARRGLEQHSNQENVGSAPQSSADAAEDKRIDFGLFNSTSARKKQRTTFGSKNKRPLVTANIHVQPGNTKIQGRALPKATSRTRKSGERTWDVKADSSREEDEDSQVSMMTDGELDECLNPKKKSKSSDVPSSSVKPVRPKLLDQLGEYLQDRIPTSSQASSSTTVLENVEDYIRDLLDNSLEDSRCGLCQAEVSQEYYSSFWKGKEKTVKNQTAFCNAHKMKAARDEYEAANYPEIDWDGLPRRIKRYRKELLKVLNNERPSAYRDRYEPVSLTGKAAAVPNVRKDLSAEMREEIESFALDDPRTYPGYYGPRGRRLITETVFPEFYDEISKCSDPVVQASSPAAFIQAVLVPELAVLLIMDDCGVDREEAEEIKERSTEIGNLLHEEIEDEVNLRDDSEEENDYDEQ